MHPELALRRVKAICDGFGILSLDPQLRACERLLAQGQVIEVAVFGRFKSGKSSFINSLAVRGHLAMSDSVAISRGQS